MHLGSHTQIFGRTLGDPSQPFCCKSDNLEKKLPITKKWDPGISRFLCKRVIFVSHIEDQWPMQCRMIMMRATSEQVDSRWCWCWWLTWAGRIQISCRASGYLVAIAALRTSSWAGKQWCVLRIAQNKTIYIFSFWELETIEYHKMDLNGPISWWVLLSWKNRLLVTVQQTWYLSKNLHCRIFRPKINTVNFT